MQITFAGRAPELDGLPGVHITRTGESTLHCEVTGDVGPLIAALAGHPVVALASREPSLEEIFLHHYDSDGRDG
jgi:ABC-2 type transport system ATP-binding protein